MLNLKEARRVITAAEAKAQAIGQSDPFPVHLDDIARGIVRTNFDAMALSIAAYEASSCTNRTAGRRD
jgi:hypothetical protein